MATGGIFHLITNDCKCDRLLMKARLNDQIKSCPFCNLEPRDSIYKFTICPNCKCSKIYITNDDKLIIKSIMKSTGFPHDIVAYIILPMKYKYSICDKIPYVTGEDNPIIKSIMDCTEASYDIVSNIIVLMAGILSKHHIH